MQRRRRVNIYIYIFIIHFFGVYESLYIQWYNEDKKE